MISGPPILEHHASSNLFGPAKKGWVKECWWIHFSTPWHRADIPVLWNCGIVMFLLLGADVQMLLFVRSKVPVIGSLTGSRLDSPSCPLTVPLLAPFFLAAGV